MKIAQLSKDGEDFYPVIGSEGLANVIPVTKGGTGRTDLADMVIETGSVAHGSGLAGNWYYRKWASGIAECWGTFTFTASDYAVVNSWSGYYVEVVYPNGLFSNTPTATFSGTVSTAWTLPNTILNESSSGGRYFFAVSTSGNQSCTIRIHLFGLWKAFEG